MSIMNDMRMDFLARPENEAFARMVISAFMLPTNPTLEQLGDVKTAVSEAVTNAIVHAYHGNGGTVRMRAVLDSDLMLTVDIVDNGCGIEDIEQARQPFYSSDPGLERSGMGFTVMESFMDKLQVTSEEGKGTAVTMTKYLDLVSAL